MLTSLEFPARSRTADTLTLFLESATCLKANMTITVYVFHTTLVLFLISWHTACSRTGLLTFKTSVSHRYWQPMKIKLIWNKLTVTNHKQDWLIWNSYTLAAVNFLIRLEYEANSVLSRQNGWRVGVDAR